MWAVVRGWGSEDFGSLLRSTTGQTLANSCRDASHYSDNRTPKLRRCGFDQLESVFGAVLVALVGLRELETATREDGIPDIVDSPVKGGRRRC